MKRKPLSSVMITRFMRVFFYLLYQPMAWSYDLVAALVSWGRWKDWIMTVLPYLTGPRILELGHGPGHLQLALLEKGFETFGIDTSSQMGQQTRQRIVKQGKKHSISRCNAQNLPFPALVFDQIVATFPTEYMVDPETLLEVYRILKPGGTLLVLPAAWITGQRLVDRSTATLFRLTGQSPDWNQQWLTPFWKAGFQPMAEMITRESWSLVIISAHKPN